MNYERLEGRYQINEPSESQAILEKRLSTEIHDIAAAAEEILSRPNSRLIEREFVGYFLPMFCGEPSKAGRTEWIGMAGGAFRSVDVINDLGEILFTVPPINDPTANEELRMKSSRFDVSRAITEFEQNVPQNPIGAIGLLTDTLHIRADAMQQRKDLGKYLKEWNDIFTRYGKPLVEIPSEEQLANPAPVAAAVASGEPDTFEDA